MQRAHIAFALLVALAAGFAAAAAAQDAPGSRDHPMIARYKGSVIRAQTRQDFDSYTLPLGPADKSETKFQKQQNVEGKVFKTLYTAPAGASPLAIYRSYQNALTQAGFETLYTCAPKECSPDGRLQYSFRATRPWTNYIGDMGGHSLQDENSYLLVVRHPKTNTYAVILASQFYGDASNVVYVVDVVETKPLEGGLVKVDAKAMAEDISKTGHVSIYGIYFDTDKSVIKPESKQSIAEIAKLLNEQPSLRLHVVGHTDNVGVLGHNMTLSKQRAEAVVNALVSDYKIAASRLIANGVGPLAPVASNAAEEGRAKNRRVELVAQ